jgi:hypothetical protein
LNKFPEQKVEGIDWEYEYAHGTSYSVFVEYVIKPVAPLFTSRSEFAVAAGLSYNSLSVDGNLSGFFERPVSFAVKENALGLHLRVSYDYYYSKHLSLQLKSGGMIIPSIDVPTISNINPNNNEVKTLKQHTVNFSGIDFSVGLRIHL